MGTPQLKTLSALCVILTLSLGFSHYSSMGVRPATPTENPRPFKARVVVKHKTSKWKMPQNKREGTVLAWNDEGVLFQPEGCDKVNCQEIIPTTQLEDIQFKSPGLSDCQTVAIMISSFTGVVVIGLVLYGLYVNDMNNLFKD